MEQFSADIQGLNSRHSFIGEKLAGELSSRFPRLQHTFSAAERDELEAAGVQASGHAGVIALLPLDSSPETRQALENAFQAITATGAETIVVDMDIADPHAELLGQSGGEGVSDHFLYGVSSGRIIAPGPGSLKVVAPGTFTPRADEVYTDSGWDGLLESLSESAPGATLLLLGPPANKFPSLAALAKAGEVSVFCGRLDSESQQALPATLERLEASLPRDAKLKLVWLDTEPPAEIAEAAEKPESEEPPPADETATDQQHETDETPPPPAEAVSADIENLPVEPEPPTAETAEAAGEPESEEPPPADETATDQQHETDEIPPLPAEAVSADIENLPVEPEPPTAETAEAAEKPESKEPPPAEEATTEQQHETTDETPPPPAEAVSADIENLPVEPEPPTAEAAEAAGEPESKEPPAAEPASTQEEVTQLKADGISLDSEKLPGQRSLEAGVDNGARDDALGGMKLPGLSEKPADASTDTPKAADDDEEIFLPDELLFLDEDEQASVKTTLQDSTETTQDSAASGGPEELPAPQPEEAAENAEPETSTEVEAEADESVPEIPDLTQIDADELLPPAEEPAELVADEISPELAEPVVDGKPEQEKPEIETGTAAETDEETDTEALFSDDYLDDEDEDEAESAPAAATGDDLDGEALALIEKFRETSDRSEDAEPDLELDDDPLGQGGDEQEPPEIETAEPEAELEAEAETEVEPPPEAEPEAETEPEAEGISGEIEGEQEAAAAEPGQAVPVEEDLIDLTEGDAPLEAEKEQEAVEVEAETGEETIEEVAELDADELEELETSDPDSLDDEKTTTADADGEEAPTATEQEAGPEVSAAEAAAEKLEEIPEEAEATGAAQAETAEQDDMDVPADDELDELLSGDDTDDVDDGITLDDLDEIDDVQPAAVGKGGKARRKKAASGSRGKPVALLLMLLLVGGGLFFVWRGGYVSKLVRQVPVLSGLAGFIPDTKEDSLREQAIFQAAADSAALADSLSRIPPPPKYDTLGYSIQIGSYRYLPQAIAARDRLLGNGLADVFVVPLVLDSLGNWNRLYLGMYRSAGKGDTALQNLAPALRRSGITDVVNGGAVTRHTPLTLMVTETSDLDSLQTVMEKLESNLIPAYVVQLTGQDSTRAPLYRLYAGAFENKSQAIFLLEQIFNIGVRATVVEREGQAEQVAEQQAAPAPPV